jgi:UDP-N-acetylmuramyl pentapeptide phosphotransferase/UDP-N-acetylglucosamine-1-phosphate transferase
MASEQRRGLDRIEIGLFVFGVLAFAFLMFAIGDSNYVLPVIGLWIVGGLGFVWWVNRRLARGGDTGQGKVARLDVERRRRNRRR